MHILKQLGMQNIAFQLLYVSIIEHVLYAFYICSFIFFLDMDISQYTFNFNLLYK